MEPDRLMPHHLQRAVLRQERERARKERREKKLRERKLTWQERATAREKRT
jgi:hypothetical protein